MGEGKGKERAGWGKERGRKGKDGGRKGEEKGRMGEGKGKEREGWGKERGRKGEDGGRKGEGKGKVRPYQIRPMQNVSRMPICFVILSRIDRCLQGQCSFEEGLQGGSQRVLTHSFLDALRMARRIFPSGSSLGFGNPLHLIPHVNNTIYHTV